MKVFKFGGASVKDAQAVKNLKDIAALYDEPLLIVVSAMGKMTNAFEKVVSKYFDAKDYQVELNVIINYHYQIIADLFVDDFENVKREIDLIFDEIKVKLKYLRSDNYDFVYDQIVSFGEIISTKIISHFLNTNQLKNVWVDIRKVLITDANFRDAKVNWTAAESLVQNAFDFNNNSTFVTQGFLGCTQNNDVTTLGREGSDYTAAALGYLLNATDVIIWKDVEGVYNADPKLFADFQKLDKISYREAIELAYFGAQVIHPKTIKPLQNKNIPLYVKSFLNPTGAGTKIADFTDVEIKYKIPVFIVKSNQILISIAAKDFSFVVEENLSEIFGLFASYGVKVNLMQNSAISFSVCVNFDERKTNLLINEFRKQYKVLYNKNVELLTIHYFNPEAIDKVTNGKQIIVEQKSRNTARFVVK